mmetsp:Transcript_26941/g.67887  ORF Transcript_26941/g.67887 Transcript_26941/m.67887 type:complete len:209 (-) Transcript_26941:331-957(-)
MQDLGRDHRLQRGPNPSLVAFDISTFDLVAERAASERTFSCWQPKGASCGQEERRCCRARHHQDADMSAREEGKHEFRAAPASAPPCSVIAIGSNLGMAAQRGQHEHHRAALDVSRKRTNGLRSGADVIAVAVRMHLWNARVVDPHIHVGERLLPLRSCNMGILEVALVNDAELDCRDRTGHEARQRLLQNRELLTIRVRVTVPEPLV